GGECIGYDGHKKKKGTKIRAAVDKEGHPLRIVISAANEHDSLHFIDLACNISLKGERGRPRTRPPEINADASYDSEGFEMSSIE
ncbi:MAG: transposase, partial [Halobacteriota archaeon]|nr:transposase [Halobacteriota archaeon]